MSGKLRLEWQVWILRNQGVPERRHGGRRGKMLSVMNTPKQGYGAAARVLGSSADLGFLTNSECGSVSTAFFPS